MAENDLDFAIRVYGGLNQSDQEDVLILKSHTQSQGGFSQRAPMESADMQNIDFTKSGFKKRLGSTADTDLGSGGDNVFISGDIMVAGTEFVDSDSTDRYEILVSKMSIYISKNDAAWTQANDSAGAAYTHDAQTVTKAGFAVTDGHLFIGLDGANHIQTFKRGVDLDPEMDNGNTYEEAHSASTHTIEGTWPTGCYLVTTVHSRLVFSDADVVLYYTPMAYTASSGIWKLGSAFFFTQGRILSVHSMSPEFSDSLKEVLYIGTENGFEILTGFDPTSDVTARIEGSKAPLNHQSIAIAKNWLCYLTNEKNIYGINKTTVINLGRRLKTDGQDGFLDDMSLTNSLTNGFGIYSDDREQAYFFFTTGATTFNDICIALDFKLGEPVLGEPQPSFEQRVRCLYWTIKDAFSNDWFVNLYKVRGGVIGLLTGGTTWNFNTDNDDLDTHAVESYWKTPAFLGGSEGVNKQWEYLVVRFLPKGDWTVTVEVFTNRADAVQESYSVQMFDTDHGIWGTATWGTSIWASTQVVKGAKDLDIYSDAVQWKIRNFNADEPFEVSNMNLTYMIGAEER